MPDYNKMLSHYNFYVNCALLQINMRELLNYSTLYV
jgi:hypothetical protein